jgi:hypothetical protein
MVDFRLTAGGFDVLVNGKLFGHLQKGDGFFIGALASREFLVVSSKDLIKIAMKADEVKRYGNIIPICPGCKGTPSYPGEVCSPNEGMILCQDHKFHSFDIRHFGKF